MLPFNLFILCSLLIPVSQCSGIIEVHLMSFSDSDISVEVVNDEDKVSYDVPMVPMKRVITNVPITFGKTTTVSIKSGPLELYNIRDVELLTKIFHSQVMTIAPKKVVFPFIGMRIEIKCDRNWYGLTCDKYCHDKYASFLSLRCNRRGDLGCPLGFVGISCNLPLSDETCGCINGGRCVSSLDFLGRDTPICECPNGFEGEKCEKHMYLYAEPIETRIHSSLVGKLKKYQEMDQVPNEFYFKKYSLAMSATE